MKYYINVKFGSNNKTYYFATDFEDLKIGDFVVVETVVGLELGEVVTYPRELETLNYDREVKPILRKANKSDMLRHKENKNLSEAANVFFEESIKNLGLDMKLVNSEYTLDRAKILFTYVADDRVDFRELLKVLAAELKCRIELRQINTRERAQLVGGLGTCGLPLCCTTFLTQFDGVTLSKVKNQMLAINIPKISGQCGKLMCCLKFEDDMYTEIKKEFPPLNSKFQYHGKEFKVASFSIFTKVIKIVAADETLFITLNEFKSLHEKLKVSAAEDDIDLNDPELKEVLKDVESEQTKPQKEAQKKQNYSKTAQNPTKNVENDFSKQRFDKKDKPQNTKNVDSKPNNKPFDKNNKNAKNDQPRKDGNQQKRDGDKDRNNFNPQKKKFNKGFRPYVDPNKK